VKNSCEKLGLGLCEYIDHEPEFLLCVCKMDVAFELLNKMDV
jgi:hypothetical protein